MPITQRKNFHFIILGMLAVGFATSANAQGSLEDYRRAYSLQKKFSTDNVYGTPQNLRWEKDKAELYYSVNTPDGWRYVTYNAETDEKNVYATREEAEKARGVKPRETYQRQFPPQRERHWMEVDEENEARFVKSPDGKWDAYIEDHNLILHETGKPYTEKCQLTQDGTIGNYYSNRILWSPDSRKVFVCKRRSIDKRFVYYVESAPKNAHQPVLHKQEYAKPGDELPQRIPCIFDVESGQRLMADTALCPNQYDLGWFEWTEDSREVRMEYNARGHKVYRVLAMNAQTGALRTIVEERSDKFVNYNRTYRHYFKNTGTIPNLPVGEYLIWMSERDNWNHLYLYPLNTQKKSIQKKSTASSLMKGETFQITKGSWCVRRVIHVDDSLGVIYFSASGMNKDEDPYFIHYYKIGIDGKNLVCLTPETGNHSAQFTADYRFLVDTYSQVDKAPVTVVRQVNDGRMGRTLETTDISRLKEEGWQAPEVFVAPGRDGKTPIWGIIQRPTDFDPSRKYPIIEYIYAGPGDAYTPKSFISYNGNTTALAELGFIVVQLDGMGTSWRGKQFEEVCYKNLKDAGFPDRMAWIRAAAQKYPYMDIDRVGIFGASAGGQESTTAVLLHGDFYKAAYSSCGCHDNRMDKIWWNEQWMGYPVDSCYVESSNVYHAAKLQRPLMLVVGEMDDNVDPASTMQVVDALIKANKDFELVVLPGVRHTMGERYGEHKRFDFFVKHLLGVEPPKWNELE